MTTYRESLGLGEGGGRVCSNNIWCLSNVCTGINDMLSIQKS